MIKRLGAADWPAMQRLRFQRHSHAGFSLDSFTSAPLLSINTRYQSEPNLVIGWEEAGTLKAFICAYGTDTFWVLDLMVSDGEAKHLQACLEECLRYYEARGVQKFYYAFPKKWAKAYKTFWKEGAPSLRKYVISDIGIIDAYVVPSEHWIWEHVLHKIVIPVPLLLRMSSAEPTRQ